MTLAINTKIPPVKAAMPAKILLILTFLGILSQLDIVKTFHTVEGTNHNVL